MKKFTTIESLIEYCVIKGDYNFPCICIKNGEESICSDLSEQFDFFLVEGANKPYYLYRSYTLLFSFLEHHKKINKDFETEMNEIISDSISIEKSVTSMIETYYHLSGEMINSSFFDKYQKIYLKKLCKEGKLVAYKNPYIVDNLNITYYAKPTYTYPNHNIFSLFSHRLLKSNLYNV